jgi:hypothetical protein
MPRLLKERLPGRDGDAISPRRGFDYTSFDKELWGTLCRPIRSILRLANELLWIKCMREQGADRKPRNESKNA